MPDDLPDTSTPQDHSLPAYLSCIALHSEAGRTMTTYHSTKDLIGKFN